MSYLFGAPPERRALQFIVPPIPPNSATGTGFGPQNLHNTEASLQKVAVWACVNLTATIAETMPVDVFTGSGRDQRAIRLPQWLSDPDGSGHGLPDWLYQLVYSMMLRGNGYGIELDWDKSRGTPTQIVLQHPDEVRVRRRYDEDGQLDWTVCGKKIDADRMWHKRVHPVPGKLLGLSPIEHHATTIGLGIASLQFGAQWFQDGAHPSAILQNTEVELKQSQVDTAKARFLAAIRGTREPVVLGKGWQYKAIQVAPNESQFLETNDYSAAECCRIFGPALAEIFGYKTGGTLTYANIEQRSLDLLTYAVDPWLVRVERLLSALLPKPQFVKFNRAALSRTDLLTRYRAHEIALRNRFETVNEVRNIEDMPPVDWGDQPNTPTPGPAPVTIEGGS